MEEVYEKIFEDRIKIVPGLHPGLQDLIRVLGRQAHCSSRTVIICEPYVPVSGESSFHRHCSTRRRSSLESLSGPSALWSPVQPKQYYYDCYWYKQYPDRENDYKDIEEKYNFIKNHRLDYSALTLCENGQWLNDGRDEEWEEEDENEQDVINYEENRSRSTNSTARQARTSYSSSAVTFKTGPQSSTSDSVLDYRYNQFDKRPMSKQVANENQIRQAGEARNAGRNTETSKISIVIDNKTGVVDIQAVSSRKDPKSPSSRQAGWEGTDVLEVEDCIACDEMRQLNDYRELSTVDVNDELRLAGKLTSSLKKALVQIAESFDKNIKLQPSQAPRIQPLANGEEVKHLQESINECPPVGDFVDNVCRKNDEMVNQLMTLISEADCLNRLIEHLDEVQSKFVRKGTGADPSSSRVEGLSPKRSTVNTSDVSSADEQSITPGRIERDEAPRKREDDVPCDDVTQIRGFQVISYNDIAASLNDAEKLTEQLKTTITDLVRPLLPPDTPPESFFQAIEEQFYVNVDKKLESPNSSCPAFVEMIHSSNESMQIVQRLAYLKNSSLFLNLLLQNVSTLMENQQFNAQANGQEPQYSPQPQQWVNQSEEKMSPTSSYHTLRGDLSEPSTRIMKSGEALESSSQSSKDESSNLTTSSATTTASSSTSHLRKGTEKDCESSTTSESTPVSTSSTSQDDYANVPSPKTSMGPGQIMVNINDSDIPLLQLMEITNVVTDVIIIETINEMIKRKQYSPPSGLEQGPVKTQSDGTLESPEQVPVKTRSDGTLESPFRVADDLRKPTTPDDRKKNETASPKKPPQPKVPTSYQPQAVQPRKDNMPPKSALKQSPVQSRGSLGSNKRESFTQTTRQNEQRGQPTSQRGSQARAFSEPGPMKTTTKDVSPKTKGSLGELKELSPIIKGSQKEPLKGKSAPVTGKNGVGKVQAPKGSKQEKLSSAAANNQPTTKDIKAQAGKTKQAVENQQSNKLKEGTRDKSPAKNTKSSKLEEEEEPLKLKELIGKFEKDKAPKQVKDKMKTGVQDKRVIQETRDAAEKRQSGGSKQSGADERQNAKLAALIGKFEKEKTSTPERLEGQGPASKQKRSSSVCAREDSQTCVDYEVDDTILYFARITANAFPPVKESYHAAGFMLKSAYDYTIPPRGKVVVKTDLRLELPPRSYGRIAPRKCLAENFGVDVGTDVIDRDCRENVTIVLFNHSDKPVAIRRGNKIAQLICETIHQSAARENCDLLN